MNRRVEPPRLARRLLQYTLPADARDEIIADLEEVFLRLCRSGRLRRARLWYYREAVTFSGRFLFERLRGAAGPLGRGRLPGIALTDIKLGLRMLVKYPALTLMGCLALALGVSVTVGVSSMVQEVMNPTLRHPDADRIVSIWNVDLETTRPEPRSIHDFVLWRDELGSLDALGAYSSTGRNLETNEGRADLIRSAVISASAFLIMGQRPLLGRTLVDGDERPGAPPVVVIGHDVWETRFGSATDVVGRVVRIDGEPVTVVGVMPEGFRFPTRHDMWEPFRYNALDYDRIDGPAIALFGRLRPGVSLDAAQLELDAIGQRSAERFPDTHTRLRPRIEPYLRAFSDPVEIWGAYLIQSALVFLLLIVCANVGLLILARTLARTGELAVRSAMGASRGRIIGQLFVETLVLSSVAVGVGLLVAGWGIGVVAEMYPEPPFWAEWGLGATDVAFAAFLAVLSALVAGVVPGLRATGKGMAAVLHRSTGGVSGGGFGTGSHVLVVTQVFLSVSLLAGALALATAAADFRPQEIDIPVGEFFLAQLQLEPEVRPSEEADAYRAEFVRRLGEIQQDVGRRLRNEPGVTGVTFASRAPFTDHPARFVEVDGFSVPLVFGLPSVVVRNADVAPSFFDVFDAPIMSGRGFETSDIEGGDAVVVTQAFGRRLLGGRDPVGHRMRYVGQEGAAGSWFTIAGVVRDMWTLPNPLGEREPVVYHPLRPGEASSVQVIVRAPNGPESLPQRLSAIALAVEPDINVAVASMQDSLDEANQLLNALFAAVAVGFGATLLLSLAGIYAMVSFTVTRRTREIGIRTALGSQRWRLVATLLSRVMMDLGIGVLLGFGLIILIDGNAMDFPYKVEIAVTIMLVGLLTCLAPTVRGMRASPADALKAEG